MFKKLSLLMLSAFTITTGALAQTTAILRGNITTSRTLNSTTCYYLKGCVTVTNGATLTIPAGTKIFGIDSTVGTTNYPGTLIIDTAGYIIANGTAVNPIIFTSGKAPGSRAAGDWGGIVVAGTAHANQNCDGSPFIIEGPCNPIYAGGNNDADSSGVLRYVQIHYAGRAVVADNELNSLTLAAVGNKTAIDHIQVTNALDDAFEWFGGTVNAKYLVAYNTKDDDFDTDFGYRGKVQFGLALRLDTAAHDISKSHGIESDNNNVTPDYSCGTYQTRPIFSNISIVGPGYCIGNGGSEFESGIYLRRNSAHTVYNTIVTGWRRGLIINDSYTGDNTDAGVNSLNFSYNTFSKDSIDYQYTPSAAPAYAWSGTGFCNTGMTNWITGAGLLACRESSNQFLGATAISGWNNLCGNFCNAAPNFAVGTTNVNAATFTGVTDLSDAFFDVVTYRGAFGATDWTANWTNWCPQTANYGCTAPSAKPAADEVLKVTFVPNPTNGTTYAVFTTEQTGKVRVSVLDKVTGKILRSVNGEVNKAGEQRIAFNASGLREGVYFVQVQLANGAVISGQLSVF